MLNIFHAIQHERFFELPDADKSGVLEFLAQRIGDVSCAGVVEEIQQREQEFNTGIGGGVAVPHVRTIGGDGEIRCVVGWSAQGIDYGAVDGRPVHLIVMYYIPDLQRDAYLKEIAGLVKMLVRHDIFTALAVVPDLAAARCLLLSWEGNR
ncbi:MAG: PTS sugar transporter subunit IIA [Puniceicoccales bacterium]|jgi:mannitol/fructose-specific phosphotransferase system IIA component (Ntr-type)|nr:PTS sugar transporter subunit IIA [Puniceicoccales bacterium]